MGRNKPETGRPAGRNAAGVAGRRVVSRVIPKEQVLLDEDSVVVVGGDWHEGDGGDGPTIILEKKNDCIARIIVQCTCGRSAELVCEYDARTEDGQGGQEGLHSAAARSEA